MISGFKMRPVLIWEYPSAPESLRAGTEPDDADWLAVVPLPLPEADDEGGRYEQVPVFMKSGTPFAWCHLKGYAHPSDKTKSIWVGHHA